MGYKFVVREQGFAHAQYNLGHRWIVETGVVRKKKYGN